MKKNTERDFYRPSVRKPLVLALETSGRAGSVALAIGQQLLAVSSFSAPMKHSAEIFPAIFGLLERFDRKPDQIEHVYISIGPGSFTGLRIAVTFAKMMHLANAAKIVAVNTLDVIAANAADYAQQQPSRLAVILDAKRGQFFIAVYESRQGRWTKSVPDCLMSATDFIAKFATGQPLWLLGEGLVYYKNKFAADGVSFLDECYWSASAEKVHLLGWQMALAGQFADALTLQPAYLRGAEVKQKW